MNLANGNCIFDAYADKEGSDQTAQSYNTEDYTEKDQKA